MKCGSSARTSTPKSSGLRLLIPVITLRLRRQLPGRVTPFYVEELSRGSLDGADLIVSGVNSLGAHWIGRTLGPLLWPGATVIAVTKGLEASRDGNPIILPDVLREELPAAIRDQVTLAAIGGPVHRRRAGRPAAFVRRVHVAGRRARTAAARNLRHGLLPHLDLDRHHRRGGL